MVAWSAGLRLRAPSSFMVFDLVRSFAIRACAVKYFFNSKRKYILKIIDTTNSKLLDSSPCVYAHAWVNFITSAKTPFSVGFIFCEWAPPLKKVERKQHACFRPLEYREFFHGQFYRFPCRFLSPPQCKYGNTQSPSYQSWLHEPSQHSVWLFYVGFYRAYAILCVDEVFLA